MDFSQGILARTGKRKSVKKTVPRSPIQNYAISPATHLPNRECRLPGRLETTINEDPRDPKCKLPRHLTIKHILDNSVVGLCKLPEPAKSLVDLSSTAYYDPVTG
ncbi:uncharacterized protein RCO7_14838 [Rhynchosporium graminicola]|uniref:Uncharacterized protein n=1 Tax=Rhynchosporium graminicola TaxID=2792576 RepID=A0A1E1L802_9HELO|nr:uncharacterized protein RCO7_14838 [Rhynchosporium commune]